MEKQEQQEYKLNMATLNGIILVLIGILVLNTPMAMSLFGEPEQPPARQTDPNAPSIEQHDETLTTEQPDDTGEPNIPELIATEQALDFIHDVRADILAGQLLILGGAATIAFGRRRKKE